MKVVSLNTLFVIQGIWTFHSFVCDTDFCISSKNGYNYQGNVNITNSGRLCVPWKSKIDLYTMEHLKIKNINDNYCRNPNGSSTVWCYVDKNQSEACNIPICRVNPDAKYCFPIPIRDQQLCPSLFFREKLLEENIEKAFKFCCIKDQEYLSILPLENNCLVAIINISSLQSHFLLCPDGYEHKPLKESVLNNKSFYQCCKYASFNNSNIERILNMVINKNINLSLPIFGAVTDSLCQPVRDLYLETNVYLKTTNITRSIFQSLRQFCFYYVKHLSNFIMSESELGFFSLKNCPFNFLPSTSIFLQNTIDNSKIKSCWPISKNYIYPQGEYCLLTNVKFNISFQCPKYFHAYIMKYFSFDREILRFCCKLNNFRNHTILWSNTIKENDSIALIRATSECPFMVSNISISNFIINATIYPFDKNIKFNQSYSDIKSFIYNISLCNYESLKDEFAYKKTDKICPMSMLNTEMTFNSFLHWHPDLPKEEFILEYCVGSSFLQFDSFPKGKYCIYKIGRFCPLGFTEESRSDSKTLISKIEPVPDYDSYAYCCRNDGRNDRILNADEFPFQNLTNKVSFGIYLLNDNDICPQIKGMKDNHSLTIDGFLCSYRTIDDYYKWINKIIFPTLITNLNKTYFLRENWVSLTKFRYVSSVIIVYPYSKFCIVSGERCISLQFINFVIPYPVKKKFLCCSLSTRHSIRKIAEVKYSENNRLVAFVAIHGKCPKIDESVYSYQTFVEEIFEIPTTSFNSTHYINLIKLGIIPDVNSKPTFVLIKFVFCVFEILSKDQTLVFNSNGYIKPIHSNCPKTFIEKSEAVQVDSKIERNPISDHFLREIEGSNLHYATFCFPKIMSKEYSALLKMSNLCSFSYQKCTKGSNQQNIEFGYENNYSYSQIPFLICCNNNYEDKMKIFNLITTPFSLPLKHGQQDCPLINSFEFEKWKINLNQSKINKILFLCMYYKVSLPTPWPSGSYLTVSFDKKCPIYFNLIEYASSSICIRNEIKVSSLDFPEGHYCILSYMDSKCPISGIWNSSHKIISFHQKSYLLCCSNSNNFLLNIDIENRNSFSFLSYEKCSIIPGTVVLIRPFMIESNIIQCIYTKKSIEIKYLQNSSNTLPLAISIVLVLLLVILIIMVGVTWIYPRMKDRRANHFRLAAIYSNVESTIERAYSDGEEKTPSVTYSTLS